MRINSWDYLWFKETTIKLCERINCKVLCKYMTLLFTWNTLFIIFIRKRQLELESELQSLQKANLNLENLLEATKVCKRQEVSQLNKIHAETLKVGHLKEYINLKFVLSHFVNNEESLHRLSPDTDKIPCRWLTQG